MIVMVCLETATDFGRRVMRTVTSFPCNALWLIWSPHNEVCQSRKDMARFWLDAPCEDFSDWASLKLRYIFKNELEEARDTGRLNEQCWNFFHDLASLWEPDTQERCGMPRCRLELEAATWPPGQLFDRPS